MMVAISGLYLLLILEFKELE